MNIEEIVYFANPAEFRAWLMANHESASEQWVGYYKTSSGKPSMTWPESVDQALCFGWIDGRRVGVDEERYKIRFTPRKPSSVWSDINVAKVAQLTEARLMLPKGLEAFARRKAEKSGIYSFEQENEPEFSPEFEALFRADPGAWDFFQSQAPWYRRAATWLVISAKREETQIKRLRTLMADSAAGRRLGTLAYKKAAGQKPGTQP